MVCTMKAMEEGTYKPPSQSAITDEQRRMAAERVRLLSVMASRRIMVRASGIEHRMRLSAWRLLRRGKLQG